MSGIHAPLIGAGGGFSLVETISTNTLNYNLRSRAVAAGWDQSIPLIATVTFENTSKWIGSNSILIPAFDTGTTAYPQGSALYLNIPSTAYIFGMGGSGGSVSGSIYIPYPDSAPTDSRVGPTAGGPALRVNLPTFITNSGTISSGGGGGGAGSISVQYSSGGCGKDGCSPDTVGVYHGGGGGGGRTNILAASPGGIIASVTSNATIASSQAGMLYVTPAQPGSPGNTGGGGAGGLPALNSLNTSYYYAGQGGRGGTLGAAGSSGISYNPGFQRSIPPQAGGGIGAAVIGNSFITWISTGNRFGTIS